MGYFSSPIGQRLEGESRYLGNYCYGRRNVRGWRTLRFCQEYDLNVSNTLFEKHTSQRWTWISPNYKHKIQFDYILTPTNYEKVKNFNFHSDHRTIMCQILIQKIMFNIKQITNIKI